MKSLLILLGCCVCCACTSIEKQENTLQSRGKQVAFTFELGNCLACHQIADGDAPGNIGPELKNLPSRFKDKQQLHDFIWDATQFNPNTSMPPFGKNKILDSEDINHAVDYLWDLK